MKRNGNEKGVALIAAVMIVAILAGIGISFAFNMKLEEKAAANHLWRTQADAIARGGIERAIQRILIYRNEQSTFLGDYQIPMLNNICLGDGLIARSEITVLDEAGKVNINTSGHVYAAASIYFSPTGIDRGWTTAEIQPPLGISVTEIRGKFGDGEPGAAGTDDNPGWGAGLERFWCNLELGSDGIDNDGDGVVDERVGGLPIEGIDEPSEFRFVDGEGRLALNLGDRPFITVGETGRELADITLHSRDRYLHKDLRGAPGPAGAAKIDINTATLDAIRAELEAPPLNFPTAQAEQLAVNIIDFRDAYSAPTSAWGKTGIDRTLFINEVRMDRRLFGGRYEVDRVELHNPWDKPITGHYYISWTSVAGHSSVLLNENIIPPIPAGGFRLLSPAPSLSTSPGGTITLWYWTDDWALVESMDLSSTLSWDHYFAKNDPRVPAFTYDTSDSLGALGEPNCFLQGFNPNVGGEVPGWEVITDGWMSHFNLFNRDFANPGELGYIHTGRQWETLAMRDIGTRTHQGELLNRFTINHPYNRLGRININTASLDVLESLPQMETQDGLQAQRIIDRREGLEGPFTTIGDVVPYLTPVADPFKIEGHISNSIWDLINDINWIINWPSTWGERWDVDWFDEFELGDALHSFFVTTFDEAFRPVEEAPHPDIKIFYNPFDNPPTGPVCSVCGPPALWRDCPNYPNCGGSPAYIVLQPDLNRETVRGITGAIANATNVVLDSIPFFDIADEVLGIRSLLINIIKGSSGLYGFTLTGDDLDGDGFIGEDDEFETIVRSISNLITVRSDRFEIVSTSSVVRDENGNGIFDAGEETLAESRMRAIVCRINHPVLNTAGEITASNIEILHFERR